MKQLRFEGDWFLLSDNSTTTGIGVLNSNSAAVSSCFLRHQPGDVLMPSV